MLLPEAVRRPPDDRVQQLPDLGPPRLRQGQENQHPRRVVLLPLQATEKQYKSLRGREISRQKGGRRPAEKTTFFLFYLAPFIFLSNWYTVQI